MRQGNCPGRCIPHRSLRESCCGRRGDAARLRGRPRGRRAQGRRSGGAVRYVRAVEENDRGVAMESKRQGRREIASLDNEAEGARRCLERLGESGPRLVPANRFDVPPARLRVAPGAGERRDEDPVLDKTPDDDDARFHGSPSDRFPALYAAPFSIARRSCSGSQAEAYSEPRRHLSTTESTISSNSRMSPASEA